MTYIGVYMERDIFIMYRRFHTMDNKHSDACIYLPPYKLDVLKIVEYKFSCEMEAHVEVTTSLMFAILLKTKDNYSFW